MANHVTRREFLKTGLVLASSSALGPLTAAAADPPEAGLKTQAFRFVHLTDIHVEPERSAAQGFAKALRAAEALRPKPDFILTGGDLVFDVLETGPQRARELFGLYKKVIADNTSLPVHDTIGNHDVFGWSAKSGVDPDAAGYGKAMVKDLLGMPRTYQTFDHKGWRFVCLDNIQPAKRDDQYPYQGYLDGEQLDWLKELFGRTETKRPIVICEHIPLITVTGFGHSELNQEGEWRMSGALVCKDAPERLKLIRTRNVRLCLSGHIHERDRVEYFDTTFINDGAVCGNWWQGAYRGVEEGFGVFDLRTDGTFDYAYHDYGWVVKA